MCIKRQAAEGPQASALSAKSRSLIISPSVTGIPDRLTTARTDGEAHHVR